MTYSSIYHRPSLLAGGLSRGSMDGRFVDLRSYMDLRFSDVDRRLDEIASKRCSARSGNTSKNAES